MVLYTRVSTEEQAASGLGLEAQEAQLRAAAEYGRWHITRLIRDEGKSGGSLDRPGLRKALELVRDGRADGLAVAKLDRLSRSMMDFAFLLEWFDEAGGVLVALDLNVDTSTASGRMLVQVLMVFAEFERRAISDRTKAALQALRARGKPTGPPTVADHPELHRRIIDMRERGMTFQAIADELNAEGVPTMRGGSQWRVSSVQSAAGYQRRRPRRKPADLPPIPTRRAA